MKLQTINQQRIVLFMPCLFLFLGCAVPKKEMRAYIEENSRWKITENCGYENCFPMVDFLVGENIALRIEYDQDYDRHFFLIRLYVISINGPFYLRPSEATIKLENGSILKPKGFRVGLSLKQMRTELALNKPVQLKKRDGFLLFFDEPATSVSNGFKLVLDNALFLEKKHLDIPLIYFKKSPKN